MECLNLSISYRPPCEYPCDYSQPKCQHFDFCFQADIFIEILRRLGFKCVNFRRFDQVRILDKNGTLRGGLGAILHENFFASATPSYLDDENEINFVDFSFPIAATQNGFVQKTPTRPEFYFSPWAVFQIDTWIALLVVWILNNYCRTTRTISKF